MDTLSKSEGFRSCFDEFSQGRAFEVGESEIYIIGGLEHAETSDDVLLVEQLQ